MWLNRGGQGRVRPTPPLHDRALGFHRPSEFESARFLYRSSLEGIEGGDDIEKFFIYASLGIR